MSDLDRLITFGSLDDPPTTAAKGWAKPTAEFRRRLAREGLNG